MSLKPMGARLRRLREGRGWSMRQLADKSGVSAASICHFEKGTHSLVAERIVALAVALGTTTDQILVGARRAP